MRNLAILAVLAASVAGAQAPAPTPTPGPKLTITSEVFQLAGQGTATAQTVRAQITKEYFSAYYRLWNIPGAKDQAQFHLVGLRYTRTLDDIIGKNRLAFDGSQVPVFVDFGFGTKRDGLGNDPRPAFEISPGVGFPLGSAMGGKLGGQFRGGYVRSLGKNSVGFGFQSAPMIGGGLTLAF